MIRALGIHKLTLKNLQPSQFYISEKKLTAVESWFDPNDLSGFEPIPVKLLDGRPVMTDGHTRAVAALRAGIDAVPLIWEQDELDWDMYRACMDACQKRRVFSPVDLMTQVISDADYQNKWTRWCKDMQDEVKRGRSYDVLLSQYYEKHDEDTRFDARWCWVEYYTTMQYLYKYLHPGNKLLEIGAGTGRYSIALAQEGYDVTAVELVERNLDALRARITPDIRIRAIQGNALDLSVLESESYDMTLLFGPMYHLISEADKQQALSEALRVTKPGRILMVAYCITDGPMINYTFRLNRYGFLTERGQLDPEVWKFHPENGFVFEHIAKADVDRLIAGFPVERLHYVATDGLLSFLQTELETMDDETFQALLRYHLSVCEREDLIGATAHSLDVLRKL